MRTTLELPDDVFRQLKAKAAIEGTTLKELLARFVENGLRQSSSQPATAERSKLPVIKQRKANTVRDVTPKLQAKLDEEADLAKLRRSFGR